MAVYHVQEMENIMHHLCRGSSAKLESSVRRRRTIDPIGEEHTLESSTELRNLFCNVRFALVFYLPSLTRNRAYDYWPLMSRFEFEGDSNFFNQRAKSTDAWSTRRIRPTTIRPKNKALAGVPAG
jgi:hypothetical protein